MRLEKYISKALGISRSKTKILIKSKKITVNDVIVNKETLDIDEAKDIIKCDNKEIIYSKYIYIMLNKPQGFITSTTDPTDPTIMELIDDPRKKELFPVGRLDKDTTGLLLITNNGPLAHNVLSPKKHVEKTYLVKTDNPLDQESLNKLEEGVMLDNELTAKAKVVYMEDQHHTSITITEGKYHQVKRMYKSVGLNVLELSRVSFGPLTLKDLKLGDYRYLTDEEIKQLEKLC